jgi:hypothetical protein
MPRRSSSDSSTTRPLRGVPLKTAALSLRKLGRVAVALSCEVEGLEHVRGFDGVQCNGGEAEARVVVDQVENLDVGGVGQLPVGRVGLPHLVGQLGLEANPRGLGTLVRLGRDQAVGLEDPPDGRPRGRGSEAQAKVVGDGLRSGVMTGTGQLAPQLDDCILNLGSGPGWAGLRLAGAGFKGRIAALSIASKETEKPAARDRMRPRQLARARSADDDRFHQEPPQVHSPTSSGSPLCLETCAEGPVAYVLNSEHLREHHQRRIRVQIDRISRGC